MAGAFQITDSWSCAQTHESEPPPRPTSQNRQYLYQYQQVLKSASGFLGDTEAGPRSCRLALPLVVSETLYSEPWWELWALASHLIVAYKAAGPSPNPAIPRAALMCDGRSL